MCPPTFVSSQTASSARASPPPGLLAGQDVLAALRACGAGDLVLLPGAAVREGEGFLDGMTVEAFTQQVGVPVTAAYQPRDAAAALARGRRIEDAP